MKQITILLGTSITHSRAIKKCTEYGTGEHVVISISRTTNTCAQKLLGLEKVSVCQHILEELSEDSVHPEPGFYLHADKNL